MSGSPRGRSAALTLFFVAPFVAEYLLGDLGLKLLPILPIQGLMYGCGALLIREGARRAGRGWPTIILLGMAYAVIEEAFLTQSLFDPNWLGFHFLVYAPVAWLGIGAWWTLLMFNVHALWSIATPIALVDGLYPEQACKPWLGSAGLSITAVLFLLGSPLNALMARYHHHFTARPLQFAVAGAVCVLLIVLAFLLPRSRAARSAMPAPPAWATGLIAFVLAAVFGLVPPPLGWGAVAIMLALDAIFAAFVFIFSQREGWTLLHVFSLAAAAAIEYGLHAFLQPVIAGGKGVLGLIGHVIFLAVALWIIVAGARRTTSFLRARAA